MLYFTLRSGGKTVITFLFDSVFTWVVSVTLAFVLCRFTALPVLAVYALVQSADLIKVVVGYVFVKKGIWHRPILWYEAFSSLLPERIKGFQTLNTLEE